MEGYGTEPENWHKDTIKSEMKSYIGTKIIKACPMTRGDYNKYQGWVLPHDEDPNDEGYLVKYSDDYESWSPKEIFETAYREITSEEKGLIQ